MKRRAVTRTAQYPVPFGKGPYFPCEFASAVYSFADFWQLLRHFHATYSTDLSSNDLHISTVSLILKEFNIGQETLDASLYKNCITVILFFGLF